VAGSFAAQSAGVFEAFGADRTAIAQLPVVAHLLAGDGGEDATGGVGLGVIGADGALKERLVFGPGRAAAGAEALGAGRFKVAWGLAEAAGFS
jgi:hypothetical protein